MQRTVCKDHKELYSEWICDKRPCEQCMWDTVNGDKELCCIRFRVHFSISDQDPVYDKYSSEISIPLQSYLDGEGRHPWPYYNIHNIGHHMKNAQTSLERRTHFNGVDSYDSTDILVSYISADDQTFKLFSRGLSHAAFAELDKHSDEYGIQRASRYAIQVCNQTSSLARTDMPELIRPWFANQHYKIGSILFVVVSSKGAVFCTDDYKQQLFYYRQLLYQESKYFVLKEKLM